MKKLPPQSLDLGLGELIGEKSNDSYLQDHVTQESNVADEKNSELSGLFSRGEYGKVIAQTESKFSTDPEAAIYWIRSQAALGAVPLSILIAPFEKTIYEMLSLDSSLYLRSFAGEAAKEFLSSPSLEEEFKEKIIERMSELGIVLPVLSSPIVQEKNPINSHANNSNKSSNFTLFIFLAIILGGLGFYLKNHISDTESSSFASYKSPPLNSELVAGDLERQSVGSLDALLSELIEKDSNPNPTVIPTIAENLETSATVSSTTIKKEIVNTETPVEPRDFISPQRNDPPSPRLHDEPRDGFYEALVETLVLSKPQIDASPITRLRAGALLEVVGRDGVFYEVKSKGGKIGFVLVQDVAPPHASPRRNSNQIRDYPRDSLGENQIEDLPPDPFSRESIERRYDR